MLAFYISMLDSDDDKKTMAMIYEKYKLHCYHIALKLTNNHEMAEDAVHNAFMAVIKHKDEIFNLPCGKQKSKIVIITKNKAIDLLRMKKTHAYTPIDDMPDEISADDFDISSIAASQESYENLTNYIAALPEIYKTVVEMRFVHDMSNQEIAELLSITPKTVSMRISRAKMMLQELVNRGENAND